MLNKKKLPTKKIHKISNTNIDKEKNEVINYFRKATGLKKDNRIFPSINNYEYESNDELSLSEGAKQDIREENEDPRKAFQYKNKLNLPQFLKIVDKKEISEKEDKIPLAKKLEMISLKNQKIK